MLPGWVGGRVGRGRGHGAGVSGFWWGWQASARRSCAQNSELRLPSLPMWLRQPGRGRRVAGTAALHSQSEAGVALGSSPPTGPHPEQRLGVVASSRQGAVPPPLPRTLPLGWKLRASLPGIYQAKAGVCPHLNLQEQSWRKGQLGEAPHPFGPRKQLSVRGSQELGGWGEGLIIRDGPSKYRLQLNHLGGLFWVRLPQSGTRSLAHTGTKNHVVTQAWHTGARRHWGSHTEGLSSHTDT